jgi:hypothetical protein
MLSVASRNNKRVRSGRKKHVSVGVIRKGTRKKKKKIIYILSKHSSFKGRIGLS